MVKGSGFGVHRRVVQARVFGDVEPKVITIGCPVQRHHHPGQVSLGGHGAVTLACCGCLPCQSSDKIVS